LLYVGSVVGYRYHPAYLDTYLIELYSYCRGIGVYYLADEDLITDSTDGGCLHIAGLIYVI
jgi:hypothetical protein